MADTVKDKLNELICRWVQAENPHWEVLSAHLEDEIAAVSGSYCGEESCYDEDTEFNIIVCVKDPAYRGHRVVTVYKDPLTWLAQDLLPFEETL